MVRAGLAMTARYNASVVAFRALLGWRSGAINQQSMAQCGWLCVCVCVLILKGFVGIRN